MLSIGSVGRLWNQHSEMSRDVVRPTVEISRDGKLLRVHAAKHDPIKAHGAFANPGGKPNRINAAS